MGEPVTTQIGATASGMVDSAKKVIPPPSTPTPPATIPVPLKAQTIPGWWKVSGIRGLKADVSKAIAGMSAIPAHWQAALQAEIAAHPSNAVTVHAHFLIENKRVTLPSGAPGNTKGKLVLHLDISPLDNFVGGM